MTPIVALWRDGRLPIEDGLFFADGQSFVVDHAPPGLEVVEEFDLAELLAEDPDWVTSIDITREVPLPDGGFVCAGEGSHGSEGFFARLDDVRELVWVCYLGESNPFSEIKLDGERVTVTSTSGVSVTVSLETPERP
jgi:hypothetical protein